MKIIIHTENDPQDNAMLQALYSRSAKSVTDHLERLSKTGSGKFMEQYYVGYGHNSIADCGFVTMYFEGISMLAAKALEDNALYNGQECSSRYIDFSEQHFVNPYLGTKHEAEATKLLDEYRNFYVTQLPLVKAHLTNNIPLEEGQDATAYDKAIQAKTFDVLRGFLPSGSTTNCSWTTSLRKAREHLELLILHPLDEIQLIAAQAYVKLQERYLTSFPDLPVGATAYQLSDENFYSALPHRYISEFYIMEESADLFEAESFGSPLEVNSSKIGRPRRETPHKHDIFYKSTFMHVRGCIDFGSFRDLQRHRGGYCSMPMIDNESGFHDWYFNMMPETSHAAIEDLFVGISQFLEKVSPLPNMVESATDNNYNLMCSVKFNNQYLLPMGTNVDVDLVYDYKQLVYVTELRTQQTVHPTLRAFAQKMVTAMEDSQYYTNIHANMSPDVFDIKRGTQDIVQKE